MKKKIKKKHRYTKQPTPRDEPRPEPKEPTVDTSKPLWGYSPTGRIIVDDPMMTETPKRAFEQSATRQSLSNFLDPSQVTPKPKTCPRCGGSGVLKAMQMAATGNGHSIRANDKLITCSVCYGAGYIMR